MRDSSPARLLLGLIAVALLPAAVGATAAPDAGAGSALIEVHTLVMDALGTRTVARNTARVPVGGRGLLIKQVPYGGPPVSYRLVVEVGEPRPGGLPLGLSAEVWTGTADTVPPEAQRTRREESALVIPGTSFLMELAHDGAGPRGTERRILVSLTPRLDTIPRERAIRPASAARLIHFFIEVMREQAGVADPPDSRSLTSLIGHPVSFSTAVRRLGTDVPVGLTLSATAENAQGRLVTVRVELSGFEYVDAGATRLAPIRHTSLHTVRSGSPVLVTARVPEADDEGGPKELRPVTYTIRVTPRLD